MVNIIANFIMLFVSVYLMWLLTDVPIKKYIPLLAVVALLTVFKVMPIGIGVVLGAYFVGVCEDEKEKEVYTFFFHVSLVGLAVMLVSTLISGIVLPHGIINWILWIMPFVFIIVTSKTRGGADTDFMIVAYFCTFLMGLESIVILVMFFIGYVLQLSRQLCACAVEKKSYSEVKKTHRPFLLSLYLGFLVGIAVFLK